MILNDDDVFWSSITLNLFRRRKTLLRISYSETCSLYSTRPPLTRCGQLQWRTPRDQIQIFVSAFGRRHSLDNFILDRFSRTTRRESYAEMRATCKLAYRHCQVQGGSANHHSTAPLLITVHFRCRGLCVIRSTRSVHLSWVLLTHMQDEIVKHARWGAMLWFQKIFQGTI